MFEILDFFCRKCFYYFFLWDVWWAGLVYEVGIAQCNKIYIAGYKVQQDEGIIGYPQFSGTSKKASIPKSWAHLRTSTSTSV